MKHKPAGVGLIGAGKVGLVLASGLQRSGHPLVSVWDPFDGARGRAAQILGDVPIPSAPKDVVERAAVVVIAVPDDSLAAVVEELADCAGDYLVGKTILHVSGRYGAAVLAPLRVRGASTAAMHPAMAFAGDVKTEVARLAGARFAVTTDAEDAMSTVRGLIDDLGGVAVEVPESKRTLYHAALAHGSNHLVTLVVQAAKMLELAGVSDASAVLGPAMRAALDNALEHGAAGATGPVVRGDTGTVREHLIALSRATPDSVATYREVTLASTYIAHASGRIDTSQQAELRAALLDRGFLQT